MCFSLDGEDERETVEVKLEKKIVLRGYVWWNNSSKGLKRYHVTEK